MITDEQKIEFWKGWGVPCVKCGKWSYGTTLVDKCCCHSPEYPGVDLNNLFRWAVPLVIDKIMLKQECSSDVAYAILFKKWLQELQLNIPYAADTLYEALKEVMKK
ncbi:MAG: hypothetical protein KKD44_27205 [Proteobacteria bacterium]|nr:hypothetical protein [Pseudomonadota bacterium]